MKRLSIALLPLLAGTFLASSAHAQYNGPYCTNQLIAGTYAVTCSGFITPAPNASAVPMTILGVIQGDEAGNFSGVATNSVAGNVFPQKVSGQATTRTDCTGGITYNKGQVDEINIAFVIAASGDKILGMVVDKGANVSCTLTRIRR